MGLHLQGDLEKHRAFKPNIGFFACLCGTRSIPARECLFLRASVFFRPKGGMDRSTANWDRSLGIRGSFSILARDCQNLVQILPVSFRGSNLRVLKMF